MYADDQIGLQPDEVMSILEVVPGAALILVELAVDSSPPFTGAFRAPNLVPILICSSHPRTGSQDTFSHAGVERGFFENLFLS